MTENEKPSRNSTEPIRPRRPILLTLLLWIFVLWTILGWLRFFGALINNAVIVEFLPGWVFGYLLTAGLIWGLAGIPVIWGLIFGRAWTHKMILFAALIYPLIYWIERLFIWQSPEGRSNWPFMLLLTALWWGLVLWVMRSEKVRRFFSHSKKKD
ncbi:MAG: hypothetical protein ACOCYU_07525 [Brevefilum sp.]